MTFSSCSSLELWEIQRFYITDTHLNHLESFKNYQCLGSSLETIIIGLPLVSKKKIKNSLDDFIVYPGLKTTDLENSTGELC